MPRANPTPEPTMTPPPEPTVVHLAPAPRNPWPRVVVVCAVLASLTTCIVSAPGKPSPQAPAVQAVKPSPKPHRKRQPAPRVQVLLPSAPATVEPESVVDLGHNSADTHEPVNGKE